MHFRFEGGFDCVINFTVSFEIHLLKGEESYV